MKNIKKIEDCTACFACVDICPKQCITVKTNQGLEEIVEVDENICILCGQCLKVCQVHTGCDDILHSNTQCYAVQSAEPLKDRIHHSSGGLVTVLSKCMISNGGVVAATVWNKKHQAEFALISDEKELHRCVGSKYVHSDATGIYRQIVEKLGKGILVLFVGLPCQVAALIRYVNSFPDGNLADMLYTVDLVCHGTPPSDYLQEYIGKYLRKGNADEIKFRGEKDFCLSLITEGKYLYSVPANRDTYFRAFLDGVIYRENCYKCKYARPERVGDITAGDFWGLNRGKTEIDFQGRVSLCLINSEKGQALFKLSKKNLIYEKREYSEALSENKQLTEPTLKKPEVDKFKSNIKNKGFVKAIKKTESHAEVKRNIKLFRRQIIVGRLKKALRM